MREVTAGWQKARIIYPDFFPPSDVGKTLWVEIGKPEHAIIHGEIVSAPNGMRRSDYDVGAEWYWSNVTFQECQLRIAKDHIELLPDFKNQVDFESLEERIKGQAL